MTYAIKSDNIVTFAENETLKIVDGYIVIRDGLIKYVGNEKPLNCKILDATGKTVTPGLIDSHTHLVHAGSRENELKLKLEGTSYVDILKQGGGILSTVKCTREASVSELIDKAEKSLDEMLSHGTTTIEAKSGYGLDFDTEIKCLEVVKELNLRHPIDIVSTYMGAHAFPKEFKENRRGYIDLIVNKVMPYVFENKLAGFVDVFCEDGAFNLSETEEILKSAKNLDFGVKVHSDEITALGATELAGELGAISCEHLLVTNENGIDALLNGNVCAVLLPGTSFYLMTGKFAPARCMIDKGVRVALATDYNPGTCPTENLQAIMTFAAFGMKLTPEEIIKAMTLNAAYAINRQSVIGNIKAGMNADLVIFNSPNLDYIIYHFGINHVERVIKNGNIVKGDKFNA